MSQPSTGKIILNDYGAFLRGRIEFEYRHNGQEHRTGVAVMKNKQTTAISPGDEIEVALDPDNAGKAYVVHLYCA